MDQTPARFYSGLDQAAAELLKSGDFFRRRRFPAGAFIAEPGRPLVGAHFVESGLVTATDEAAPDFVWPGIVFDAGSTFGEYALVEGARPFPSTLRALTEVKTWFLSPEYFHKAVDAGCRELGEMVAHRVKLDRLLPALVGVLNRYPPAAGIPIARIVELARSARVVDVRSDAPAEPLGDGDWVFVARGEIRCGGLRVPEGSSFIFSAQATTMTAAAAPDDGAPPQLVVLPREACARAARGSLHVRRALNQVGLLSEETAKPECVGFFGEGRGATAPLALFLTRALHRLPLGDRIGLLRVVAETDEAGALPAQAELVELGIPIVRAAPAGAAQALANMKVDVVVLDTSRAPEASSAELLQTLVTRAVVLNQGLLDETPCTLRGAQLVRAVVLGQVAPGDYLAYRPGTVRLAFDNPDRLPWCRFAALSPRDQKSFERLARAVMEMRVGVALGGGGAWGYAHIALLEELERANVPVDVMSGVSFGGLAAGFYAAGGAPAMQQLVERGLAFQLYLMASALTPLPSLSQQYIDTCLDGKRLEYLETPFFPVGLDLDAGAEWSYGTGTVGFGIRAASALPGLLPPLVDVARQIRSIDGLYINNVPEGILVREGADFVIASDVVQTPPRTRESLWSCVMSGLSPLSRMNDCMRGLATLGKIGNERDAEYANLTFRPPASAASMTDFRKAGAIVEGARSAARAFAKEAAKKYWGASALKGRGCA
jgi:predicted acylesterase/phospholipase RssA